MFLVVYTVEVEVHRVVQHLSEVRERTQHELRKKNLLQ